MHVWERDIIERVRPYLSANEQPYLFSFSRLKGYFNHNWKFFCIILITKPFFAIDLKKQTKQQQQNWHFRTSLKSKSNNMRMSEWWLTVYHLPINFYQFLILFSTVQQKWFDYKASSSFCFQACIAKATAGCWSLSTVVTFMWRCCSYFG